MSGCISVDRVLQNTVTALASAWPASMYFAGYQDARTAGEGLGFGKGMHAEWLAVSRWGWGGVSPLRSPEVLWPVKDVGGRPGGPA